MSQENVEVVRRSYEAWNARAMDALRECYDPGAVILLGEGGPQGAEAIVGIDALMLLYARVRKAWDTDEMEPIAFVFTLRDGLIARAEEYLDPDEALKAVGLEE